MAAGSSCAETLTSGLRGWTAGAFMADALVEVDFRRGWKLVSPFSD
jgi:hypothetical protein